MGLFSLSLRSITRCVRACIELTTHVSERRQPGVLAFRRLGHHTKLAHHAQIVIVAPVFSNFPISDAKKMHAGRGDMSPCRSDAKKSSLVGPVIRTSNHHHIPFGTLVLN